MVKLIVSVVAGYALWTLIWLGGGQAIQRLMPDAVAEDGSTEDPTALGAVLALSVVCSLVAGLVAGIVAPRSKAPLVLGVALLATGAAVQASAWDKMPLWYHIAFLAALLPFVLLGAKLGRKPAPKAETKAD